MHIVFVVYHSLACNSGGHVLNLALALSSRGVDCSIFVPFAPDAVPLPSDTRSVACRSFDQLEAWLNASSPHSSETLVVAWTPRENVRNFTGALLGRLPCRYVVHLEDNETLITSTHLGIQPEALLRLNETQLAPIISPDASLSHPIHAARFLRQSCGVTALMDTLLSSLPIGHRTHVFWPGADEAFFHVGPVDYTRRRDLGIADDELVLAYTGNVHPMNQAEVRSLYLAVCILNRRGIPARLLRTGEDHVPVFIDPAPQLGRSIVHLGRLPAARDVADTLALANFLVQPGRSDTFNDYRFPSKLPEFFATGRPVLLPASNLGRFVRDTEHALVLTRGDGLEIAQHLARLKALPDESRKLGTSSRAFALTHFRWPDIAEKISLFYQSLLPQAPA